VILEETCDSRFEGAAARVTTERKLELAEARNVRPACQIATAAPKRSRYCSAATAYGAERRSRYVGRSRRPSSKLYGVITLHGASRITEASTDEAPNSPCQSRPGSGAGVSPRRGGGLTAGDIDR
jgi:hypothetical protein